MNWRWGDLEVRKRVVIDYKEKVTAKNDGLREGAYIPHYHEGIVSPEIARAAHMMRASRYKFGSVPDVYVIDSGALKGFVSILPDMERHRQSGFSGYFTPSLQRG